MTTEQEAARSLLTPSAIRERCASIYAHVGSGASAYFALDEARLEALADRVAAVTKGAYPDLAIPYHSRWNHIRAGGVDRRARFEAKLSVADDELTRRRFEYVITSVLLDAGAGPDWSFSEDGVSYGRSEGLAVAAASAFEQGLFSEKGELCADAAGLRALSAPKLADAFQVSPSNPLVGVEGRVQLLNRLGDAIAEQAEFFGPSQRLGALYDALLPNVKEGTLPAASVLRYVLDGLGAIWPGRIRLGGRNLGDVWRHSAVASDGPDAGLVPFHKLSQWLSYSLLEPLEWAGLQIVELDALTGLAEYRNGGLFIDGGVIQVKDDGLRATPQKPDSEAIVEWRALTICLLDRIAPLVRKRLGVREEDFPLAKVLEGGTWQTGRVLAKELRADGTPPIRLDSDGTVF